MRLKKLIKPLVPDFLVARHGNRDRLEGIGRFSFDSNHGSEVKKDIQKKYGHNSDLLEYFISDKETVVHKWHHYIPLYHRYFSSYRGLKVRFLEIGVSQGGSLQMWRSYFGDDAIIFGIDINPECEKFNCQAGQVRIGSQIDESFLESVVKEMGGLDIVLDDGSHQMKHIPATLKHLFPHLNYGGIYMIEDLHTAYWRKLGGGYRAKMNFFALLMDFVDDMHRWYHGRVMKHAAISQDCSGIHIHDSIVVLEKNKVYKPVHSNIGGDDRS